MTTDKRFERQETVFQWHALVLCQLEDASERQVEFAKTFLKIPPAAWALLPYKAAA